MNDKLEILHQAEVKFDHDFPEFLTDGGVKAGETLHEFWASPIMWAKAVDTVLDRLFLQGANFCSVLAISGSCQQHGR